MGTFVQRIAKLEAEVGDGDLVMGGIVGQAYAAKQHEIHRYLEVPFASQRDEMLMRLAEHAVVPSGSHLRRAARDNSEMFDQMVRSHAPVEKGILQDSTYSYVTDAGRLIYASSQRDARVLGKYEGVPGPEE